MEIVTAALGFSLGWFLGSWFRARTFDNLNWRCLRWNEDVFGYRPVAPGQKLHRSDKLIMALDLDPGGFPEEGMVFGEDDL
jgi:hypothetical protein